MVSDLVWGEDNAGSNPVTPTILNSLLRVGAMASTEVS